MLGSVHYVSTSFGAPVLGSHLHRAAMERNLYVFRVAICIYKKGNCAYAIDLCIINMYVISKFNWGLQLSVQLERIL